ncbi:MAG: ABC transporter permease [Treponema sp.]|nr:ABC transporter permease [Treponema sp.]
MEKAITIKRLALENIKRKPFRTAALITLTSLSAAVLFASLIITSSLKSGIRGFKNRLGADLMIVPAGYEGQLENILLNGEPNYFYMDKSTEEIIRGIQGVKEASGQFYLTSLSESCCDFPIQIIGFEPDTDFLIQNWAKTKVRPQQGKEYIFSGSNISTPHNEVKFFGQQHKITARLSKSSTGMDNAIYADLNTLQNIFEDAKSKGFGFISDGDTNTKISSIFVKLEADAKADSTALRIKTALPEVQVITGSSFISNLAERISGFVIFPQALSIIILLITIFTLGIVFSLIANERFKEYSILRVLGADSATLKKLLLFEAGAIGFFGAIIGIFVSALIVLPFNLLISEKIGLPFSLSNPLVIAGFALISFAIIVLAALISALYSAIKISKKEVVFK